MPLHRRGPSGQRAKRCASHANRAHRGYPRRDLGGATLAPRSRSAAPTPGAKVLCIAARHCERLFSTPLFADIPADMDDTELELSRSTPNYRFDVKARTCTRPSSSATESRRLHWPRCTRVRRAAFPTGRTRRALCARWCESAGRCAAVPAARIEYRSIDLDSVAYRTATAQPDTRSPVGAHRRADHSTVFIGGQFIAAARILRTGATAVPRAARRERCGIRTRRTRRSEQLPPGCSRPAELAQHQRSLEEPALRLVRLRARLPPMSRRRILEQRIERELEGASNDTAHVCKSDDLAKGR